MDSPAFPRSWLPAALAALALTGAGCQAGVTGGPADQARSAAESFVDACSQEEVVAAMDILTPEAQRTFLRQGSGLDGCVTFLGLARPDQSLSPSRRLDLLHKTRVVAVTDAGSAQFINVVVQGPDGRRHALDAEQRGDDWQLANPALAAQTAEPEAKAETATSGFLEACRHENAANAIAALVPPERPSFTSEVKRSDVSTACLSFLDLAAPDRLPTAADREDYIDRTEIGDVGEIDPATYSVTLEAPDGRERELDAKRSQPAWLLDRP